MIARQRAATITGGVLILGGLGFFALRGNGASQGRFAPDTFAREGSVQSPANLAKHVSSASAVGSAAPTATSSVVADSVKSVAAESGRLSPEAGAKLLDIATLGQKAFVTEEEKARRAVAMNDPKFLREIAVVLRSQDLDQSTRRQQYQAIDALVASAVAGTAEAQTQLRGIVSDKQIEDASLPQPVRENLAGIKAEVLYNWTSRAPAAANDIADSLPGPVSEKIWQNVKDTQSRNANEPVSVKR